MKHPPRTTALLLSLFLTAQIIGLSLVSLSITATTTTTEGAVLTHSATTIGERPHFTGYQSFLYLLFGVALGTILLLYLMKFRKLGLWKAWYFLAVFLSMSVAFGELLPHPLALLLGALLATLKIFRPTTLIHNLTEVFIYAGLAVLLVPLFEPFWIAVLLVLISIYDVIAVKKTKHMVRLAQFQTTTGLFAGLMLGTPARRPSRRTTKRAAILGGGDIAFPLLFAGVIMEELVRNGLAKTTALLTVLIIPFCAAAALLILFIRAKKGAFYPAMPAVTTGAFTGWLLLHLFL